jgi:hypothetical protein
MEKERMKRRGECGNMVLASWAKEGAGRPFSFVGRMKREETGRTAGREGEKEGRKEGRIPPRHCQPRCRRRLIGR